MFAAQIFIKITYRAYRSRNRCDVTLFAVILFVLVVELPYWFKTCFGQKILGIVATQGEVND